MENEESNMRRAEIDTRAPFRSVKEAVMIFGEKVLAGEIYANKLNQIRSSEIKDENYAPRLGSVVAELEETKQNLKKAREESEMMANCLTSLKEELDKTKLELIQLKAIQSNKQVIDSEIEDLKFVENSTDVEIKIESPMNNQGTEFQKKRSVKFANPPSLTQIINTDQEQEQVLERQFSVDSETSQTKKKKKLMPMIAAIFSKKKGYQDGARTRVEGVSYTKAK